jgi:hypothetical protein
MGRSVAEATNACRIRCTRGDMRRLRFLAAALFVLDECALFDVAGFALAVFEDPLPDLVACRVAEAEVFSDCFPKARGEPHRDPPAIPATKKKTNVREDNTLTVYRRKLAPITEISSSARLRTSSAWR